MEAAKQEEGIVVKETDPQQGGEHKPTLDEELDQVVQSLGKFGTSLTSFWGNVKKQGTEAYQASRREIEARSAPLVTMAKDEIAKTREEIGKIGEQLKQQAAAQPTASTSAAVPEVTATSLYGEIMPVIQPEPPKERDISSDQPATSPSLQQNAGEFFSKLQSQISANPNIASIQKNLQDALHKLPPNLQESSKSAEALFNKAGKDLERYFNQAVKIVPPTASAPGAKDVFDSTSSSVSTVHQQPTRKQTLIDKLASNQSILLVDPALPPSSSTLAASPASQDTFKPSVDSREAYAQFLQSIEDQGGLEAESFQSKIREALTPPDAPVKATFSALVPGKLSSEAFWTRYFFRVGQIEEEDARRKQVLQSAAGTAEEEFSWENDEEEDTTSVTPSALHSVSPTHIASSTATSASVISEHTEAWSPTESRSGDQPAVFSARNSSEEGTNSSYDLLSSRNESEAEASVPKPVQVVKPFSTSNVAKPPSKAQEEEDEDSDWE